MVHPKGGPAAQPKPFIDRNANIPVYIQLADIICQQINAGIFHPGDQLPSEAMLVDTYQVSPMTVRRTINLLVERNVVSTTQGRGTFVKAVQLGMAAFGLSKLQEMFSNVSETSIKLITAKLVAADERIADKLEIKLGDYAVYIRRLLMIRNQPTFYHRGYLIYDPRRPIVESELEVTVLKGLFEGTGNSLIKRGDLEMEAILLTEHEAEILTTSIPCAGMRLEHIFYDFNDKPISWGWFVSRSEHLKLHTSVGLK
jgi:DNA-binding GntR family transcriptional regulator